MRTICGSTPSANWPRRSNLEGIKPKPRLLANGTTIAAPRFMVGPLAHMLKNRFYIGEVAYRGEVHKGEHAPILEHELFNAVQAKLGERTVQRRIRRSHSPALLAGLIFDDRGTPMSPSHANKQGVRYRYYVSQALLQNRKSEAGSVSRVSGPDIEAIVIEAVRQAIADPSKTKTTNSIAANALPDSDKDLIAHHVVRVVLCPRKVEITLIEEHRQFADAEETAAGNDNQSISVPLSPPVGKRRKGVVHLPASQYLDPRDRDALLTAIAKARSWMDDLIDGRVQSFEEIAEREQKVVRHIRFLAPLAFLSPRIIAAIANGDVPAGVTVSGLVRSLPQSWSEQEQQFGLRRPRIFTSVSIPPEPDCSEFVWDRLSTSNVWL